MDYRPLAEEPQALDPHDRESAQGHGSQKLAVLIVGRRRDRARHLLRRYEILPTIGHYTRLILDHSQVMNERRDEREDEQYRNGSFHLFVLTKSVNTPTKGR